MEGTGDDSSSDEDIADSESEDFDGPEASGMLDWMMPAGRAKLPAAGTAAHHSHFHLNLHLPKRWRGVFSKKASGKGFKASRLRAFVSGARKRQQVARALGDDASGGPPVTPGRIAAVSARSRRLQLLDGVYLCKFGDMAEWQPRLLILSR